MLPDVHPAPFCHDGLSSASAHHANLVTVAVFASSSMQGLTNRAHAALQPLHLGRRSCPATILDVEPKHKLAGQMTSGPVMLRWRLLYLMRQLRTLFTDGGM